MRPMPDWTIYAALLPLALNQLLVLWLTLRRRCDGADSAIDRPERELRDELGRQGKCTRTGRAA
jgi:hypothetical protein